MPPVHVSVTLDVVFDRERQKLETTGGELPFDYATMLGPGELEISTGMEIRERREPKQIKLDQYGLVDMSVFLEYLDGCKCHLLEKPRDPSTHEPQVHHAYFPDPEFRSSKRPEAVIGLRGNRLNLVRMLTCQEDLYHQDVIEDKFPLEAINERSARRFRYEGDVLDEYVSMNVAEAALKVESEFPRKVLSASERNDLMGLRYLVADMKHEATEKLKQVEVIHPAIVTGFIKTYADVLGYAELEGLAKSMYEEYPAVIYTQRSKSFDKFCNAAKKQIDRRIISSPPAIRKTFSNYVDLSFIEPDTIIRPAR